MNLAKKCLIFGMLLPSVSLGACGYDVEINLPGGKVVSDALGISKSTGEPQLRDRGPLVAPPKGVSLPEPGSGGQSDGRQVATTTEDWPVDPDAQARQIRAAEENKGKNKITEEERLRELAVNNEDPTQSKIFQNKKISDKYRKDAASDEDSYLPSN